MLDVLHHGQQHAGIADDRATGFKQNLDGFALVFLPAPAIDFGKQAIQIVAYGNRLLVVVGNADAATDIHMMQRNAFGGELIDQLDQLVDRRQQWRVIQYLRTYMTVDADHGYMRSEEPMSEL